MCVCVCVNMYVHANMNVSISNSMHVGVHASAYTCIYIHVQANAHECMQTYTYTHTFLCLSLVHLMHPVFKSGQTSSARPVKLLNILQNLVQEIGPICARVRSYTSIHVKCESHVCICLVVAKSQHVYRHIYIHTYTHTYTCIMTYDLKSGVNVGWLSALIIAYIRIS